MEMEEWGGRIAERGMLVVEQEGKEEMGVRLGWVLVVWVWWERRLEMKGLWV
ncbi:hypothetical protein [Kocuria rosea]|uniref:hypothetical protein n=1 Tax=Kocuria rosea TaxID=1275 RepID=UPI001643E45C|nr:hypothetical protein [Kocuria rosea]